jgi:Dyp-type peroxidase family
MTRDPMELDLTDIQGNVLRGYRLPFARYTFVNLTEPAAAMRFVARLSDEVTTAETWDDGRPRSTLNIALSRTALSGLGLPAATVQSFPSEFLEGMANRAGILGDAGASAPEKWDRVWQGRVDVLLMINATTAPDRDGRYRALRAIADAAGGATFLGDQDAAALVVNGSFAAIEHFGFADGYAQPDFVGGQASDVPGDGKLDRRGRWQEIATGEFLLGYRNEAAELPVAPIPGVLAKNATFMVYRKLEQDVRAFRAYVSEWGARYGGGPEKLMAKFAGRWRDGTPVAVSPDRPEPAIAADVRRNNDFTYEDDPDGLRCPLGAHIRRVNPRDSGGFNGRLATRRRIIRRGLPYGPHLPDGAEIDAQERGIVFMALNASLSRQFEFVQQQWINYGNDFCLGEERDPLIGGNDGKGRFVIPGDTANGEEPFICSDIPSFVRVRGGDYFFIPSMTALRLLGRGHIDPR